MCLLELGMWEISYILQNSFIPVLWHQIKNAVYSLAFYHGHLDQHSNCSFWRIKYLFSSLIKHNKYYQSYFQWFKLHIQVSCVNVQYVDYVIYSIVFSSGTAEVQYVFRMTFGCSLFIAFIPSSVLIFPVLPWWELGITFM